MKPRYSLYLLIALAAVGLLLHFVPISTKERLRFVDDGSCPNPRDTTEIVTYRVITGGRTGFDSVETEGTYFDDLCSVTVKHTLYVL